MGMTDGNSRHSPPGQSSNPLHLVPDCANILNIVKKHVTSHGPDTQLAGQGKSHRPITGDTIKK
jgi:hypothetical protein